MKVLPFTLPTVITNTMIGLLFLGITIPPFNVTATYHDQSAADNNNDVTGFKPDATLFLPGAPVAALNDHQRRYHMYTINRKLDLSSCEDSPLKVLTTKKIKSAKTCAFIGKKPKQRCKRDAIKSHCPNACRSCESFGTSDSEGAFLFEGAKTTCAWLHDRTFAEASYWCQFDSLRATCRETCGFFCADEPEQSNAPSSSPTTCSDKITSIINERFGDVVKGPPQEQALAWLVEDIANNECDNEAVIIQRYILAVLYYSTGGDDWYYNEGWLESTSECNWEGLECNDNQQVRNMNLSTPSREAAKNYLRGTIPAELSSLTNLEHLYLSLNSLSGSIPGSIFQLPKLEGLDLSINNLTGKIPDNFGGSTSLKYIYLDNNSLTGTIPDITGDSLQSIEQLELQQNKLSGSIPGSIFRPPKLEWLIFNSNDLTGKIPDNFGGSTSLKHIFLYNNLLTGTIPDVTRDSLQSVQTLALYGNKLSGSISGSIFALPKLESLDLSGNDLTGKIPDNFGGSSSLKYIWLDDNLLTGTIPDVTGDSLQSIQWLYLHSNKMSGPVPEGICALQTKPIKFRTIEADCAPPDNAQNPCSSDCCTKCFVGKGLP